MEALVHCLAPFSYLKFSALWRIQRTIFVIFYYSIRNTASLNLMWKKLRFHYNGNPVISDLPFIAAWNLVITIFYNVPNMAKFGVVARQCFNYRWWDVAGSMILTDWVFYWISTVISHPATFISSVKSSSFICERYILIKPSHSTRVAFWISNPTLEHYKMSSSKHIPVDKVWNNLILARNT